VQQPEASELRSRHTVPGELATWLLFIIVQAPRTGTAINIDEGRPQQSGARPSHEDWTDVRFIFSGSKKAQIF